MNSANARGRGANASGLQESGIPTASSAHHTTVAQKNGQADLLAYAKQLAETARDTGLDAAERHDGEWADRAYVWIHGLELGTILCANDVRRQFSTSSAMGSVFRKAAHAGLIVAYGLTESDAPSRRRGLQRTWRRSL